MRCSSEAIIVLTSLVALAACSADPLPVADEGRKGDETARETGTSFELTQPNWRSEPGCFEPDAEASDKNSGVFDVENVKWRAPRSFRGYYSTHLEGASFVMATRSENPDDLGIGRYWTDLSWHDSGLPSTFEVRTYWIEFTGKEALCNSQRPEDVEFDVPFSPNLVQVENVELLERVR